MDVLNLSDNIVMYRCRLCLKVSLNVMDLFTQDFPKMIKILTTLEVCQTDNLPQVACTTCARAVKEAMNIRKKIILSYRTLRKEAQDNAIQATETTIPTKQLTSEEIISDQIAYENNHAVYIKEECIKINDDVKSEDNTVKSSIKSPVVINEKIPVIKSGKKETPKVDLKRMSRSIKITPDQETPAANNQKRKIPGATVKRSYIPTPCKICQKVILNCNMKKHMEVHDRKIRNCPICDKECTTSTTLRSHIYYFHKCKADQYVCDQCGKSYRYRNTFNLHMKKEHGGKRDIECYLCGKKFFGTVNLKRHINMKHMKLRPHICEYCGKGFSKRYALRTHVRQHTNEAPFQCSICGMNFRQRVSLRGHLKSRHSIEEESKFFCDVCGKGFASEVALGVHSRLHAELKCPWCSERFAENVYLEKHIHIEHPNAN